MQNRFHFTSEQVSDGHPDKMCDYVSDAILDAHIAQDPFAAVACETLVKNNTVIVAGEIKSTAKVDHEAVIRQALTDIGYTEEATGFNPKTCTVTLLIDKQSAEIANTVHEGKKDEDIGAGDQGLMIGYATNECEEMLPLTLVYATKLITELRRARREGTIKWLMPDAKTQVTMLYEKDEQNNIVPVHVETVLVSTQHTKDIDLEEIRRVIKEDVILKIIPPKLINDNTKFYINPSDSFIVGGPKADAGVTGRKIIADTYGGWGGHGGGAFSGKDPTKVDRSGAYAARWIAKSLVANGYCKRCVVQVSYGIGITHPVSIFIDTHGTVKEGLSDGDLVTLVMKNFDLRPGLIIRELKLRRPIYKEISLFNHFMPKPNALWEVPKKF